MKSRTREPGRNVSVVALAVATAVLAGGPRARAAPPAAGVAESPDDARRRSEQHYRSGVSLFEAGNREQALVEFRLALELFPSNGIVFMIAQCQYHLGRLREARVGYREFLDHATGTGELVETARVRLAAIDRRPGIFVINTVPDDVSVTLESDGRRFTGQAPNEFEVPRGRYKITVAKPNFQMQSREVEIDVAESRPLFFKLDPVPARLSIRTGLKNATLYVRGMRAEHPYAQNVEPGSYEIYAEAPEHLPRRETIVLGPGESRMVDFSLEYVQRSGRPELIVFWTGAGALAAAGGVAVRFKPSGDPANGPQGPTVLLGAAAAGGLAGALLANTFSPTYIKDNLALFRIGTMLVGAAEGIGAGLMIRETPTAAWIGGAAGLGVGAVAGASLDHLSPKYGRVMMIQSATAAGLMAGLLAVPAFNIDPSHTSMMALAGLNLGLGAGLALAYLPDQTLYGPRWQRVLLVDIGGLAGVLSGVVVAQIAQGDAIANKAAFDPATTGRLALIGEAIGLAAGWLLTRTYDQGSTASDGATGAAATGRNRIAFVPSFGALPVVNPTGALSLVPAVVANGRF